jgi:hypothetical protein
MAFRLRSLAGAVEGKGFLQCLFDIHGWELRLRRDAPRRIICISRWRKAPQTGSITLG